MSLFDKLYNQADEDGLTCTSYRGVRFIKYADGSILANVPGYIGYDYKTFANNAEFRNYILMRKHKKKEKEEDMQKGKCIPTSLTGFVGVQSITLGTCTMKEPYPQKIETVNYNQEGENPMNDNIERDQRAYLGNELRRTYADKIEDLRREFRINPIYPKNLGDAIERIQNGEFTMKEEAKKHGWDSWVFMNFVSFEDPKNPADEAGFEKAREAAEKAYKDAERVIKIKSPEAGLEALVEFEKDTFH